MEIILKNKTAWVFGGSRGIGRSIALELARAGANIVLIARNKIQLQKVKDELSEEARQKHDVLSVDVSRRDVLIKTLKSYASLNPADILINNSGGPPPGQAHTAELEEYSDAFNQHVLAAQSILKIALPEMKRNRFGRVINIISTSVKQPIDGLGVSNTIRGAIANWGKTVASELGGFGVTVNNVLPGATKTDRLLDLIQKNATKTGSETESVVKKMQHSIPVGRFADPAEIAYLVVFLSSDYAAYINGVNIPVDGGRTKSL